MDGSDEERAERAVLLYLLEEARKELARYQASTATWRRLAEQHAAELPRAWERGHAKGWHDAMAYTRDPKYMPRDNPYIGVMGGTQ